MSTLESNNHKHEQMHNDVAIYYNMKSSYFVNILENKAKYSWDGINPQWNTGTIRIFFINHISYPKNFNVPWHSCLKTYHGTWILWFSYTYVSRILHCNMDIFFLQTT
jgi:hypothetical protein